MAGKLLLGNRTIALLFAGETPIQRVVLGGRVLWASLLRLPAEQRSAIEAAVRAESRTAEAEGFSAGIRAVCLSDNSAALLSMAGFAAVADSRAEHLLSPILISVCKPQFFGTPRAKWSEDAQTFHASGMAYSERAGVRESYAAHQADMARAAQETEADSRYAASGDTADMEQLSPVIISGVSTKKASVLTGDARTAEAVQAARSSARGSVNPSRAVQAAEPAGARQTCTVSIRLIRDGVWAEQEGNTLRIYQAFQAIEKNGVVSIY